MYTRGGAYLQAPWPATEPRNPETPKVHLKVRKMPFWNPPDKWPQKSIKMSKQPGFGHFNSPKTGFLDILIDFWGHFSRGSKMAFFGLLNALLGFRGFRGSVAGQGVWKGISNSCGGGFKINTQISDTGKRKPALNLGSTLPWTLFPPPEFFFFFNEILEAES